MSLIDEWQGTACLTGAGFDANQFFELIEPSEIKDELIRNTERSVERGTFGSPTFELAKYWPANLAVAIMAPRA